jgi:glucose/arabinose dehydrogenase
MLKLFAATLLVVYVQCVVHMDRLRTLPGFSIRLLTEQATQARQMSLSEDEKLLFVGSWGDKIHVFDVTPGENMTLSGYKSLISGFSEPTGAYYDAVTGDFFFSDLFAVYRMPNVKSQIGSSSPTYTKIRDEKQPDPGSGHIRKYLKIHNDRLFIPHGSPCNTCLMDLPYGTIGSVQRDGSDYKLHARGIRNSVGYAVRNNQLWFTENSRDNWGDDKPKEELNLIEDLNTVQHYGFPFCYEKNTATDIDTDYNSSGNCNGYTPAKYLLDAHIAPLGMTFYNAGTASTRVPAKYQGDNIALIAEHGSWNRAIPNVRNCSFTN